MGAGKGKAGTAGGKGKKKLGGGGGAMSDEELSNIVDNALNANLPDGFHDDMTQRLIYTTGLNDKPEVLPLEKVQAMAQKDDAIVLYRGVVSNKNESAEKISNSLIDSNQFNTGGFGGQTHGGGTYFTSQYDTARGYSGMNPLEAHITGGVLNKNARVISLSDVEHGKGAEWASKHPKTAAKLGVEVHGTGNNKFLVASNRVATKNGSTAGNQSTMTAVALAMGYNVVKAGRESHGTYTILDRSAISVSRTNHYIENGLKGEKSPWSDQKETLSQLKAMYKQMGMTK